MKGECIMQNTFMNTSQFLMEVNALFGAGLPTSEEFRLWLVPIGAINTRLRATKHLTKAVSPLEIQLFVI